MNAGLRRLMQESAYLTTEEAADYLRLKERKLYELVAEGAIPCSKVTGRWLFPRGALDRWVAAGLARPEGFVAEAPPPIVGGSHDPLLEWALRQSGSGLALLAEGSEAGLDRLERNEVAAAAIHLHGPAGQAAPFDDTDHDSHANVAAVAARAGLHDAVVLAFARREQGFLVAPGNPLGIGSLADVERRSARLGLRPTGAGAQLLLEAIAARAGIGLDRLRRAPAAYPAGPDLALAIRSGEIDCGIATRAVAELHGLGFVPLTWERYDLVLRRRGFFEPVFQRLAAFLTQPAFAARAAALGGYDVTETGTVRLNRGRGRRGAL